MKVLVSIPNHVKIMDILHNKVFYAFPCNVSDCWLIQPTPNVTCIVYKKWCRPVPDFNIELPEDLFDL